MIYINHQVLFGGSVEKNWDWHWHVISKEERNGVTGKEWCYGKGVVL